MSNPDSPMGTPATTEYLGPEEDKFSGINNSPEPKLKILTGNDAPWPGSSYVIGYQNTSKVLTYKDQNVVLAEYEGKPTQRWACHARDGWLGFANDPGETTLWLGIGDDKKTDPPLLCRVYGILGSWETFCVMKRPEDGFLVLKRVKERLRPIGTGPDGSLSVRVNWGHWWGFTKIS
ncbi:hypothetical protein TWF225_004812 [Orbilia oligospora]|uniref:Uncharacterized protein n=1 Tax=Orbilia oligospora TaxID=2813651 RepID=A0A7C8TU63_ORBOL|nr:hypothetical protein TWF706_010085 [Orbilia oligospora]KAF3178859.1 hypothetical protein TWF751_000884 [Orbilia oligospora]KAF3186294.1 hypothetical protein TWF225_004812 [Orbilia oligospora]KAF3260743.1 hypothetical protein TWF128_003370 [Orbilia oligospora]KAF3272690.1 hypothetical protein TWF217_000163 [Orbilia oligospora]